MKFQALALLLLLACMYPSLAQGSYENCCLKYISRIRRGTKKLISSYRIQETDGGCNIPAYIFILPKRANRISTLCADPSKLWVQNLAKDVDLRRLKL